MRTVIERFDGTLRRANGVFEFAEGEWCVLRLQHRNARYDTHLSDGTQVREGEPILGLHLWNEQIPRMGVAGPDLAWGAQLARRVVRSLRAVAAWIESHPEVADRRVVSATTVLAAPGGGLRFFQRLGFEALPFRNRLGAFGEFWENLYTWGLMWTYNRESVRHRPPWRLRRTVLWMPVGTLLTRYGSVACAGHAVQSSTDGG